jgi:AraC family transcriptional regulator
MAERPKPITPDEWFANYPFRFRHSRVGLGWSGIRVDAEQAMPACEVVQPPLENLMLILHGDIAPEGVAIRCGGSRFDGTGTSHSLTVVPPGADSRWRRTNVCDSTQFHLTPALVSKVAQEAFDLDPARLTLPVLFYSRSHPAVVAAQAALREELLTGGPGGRLCAESLATVLVVQLLRHVGGKPGVRGLTGVLAPHALRAVEGFVADNLHRGIGLADLAAVAHLSQYHFARLFKQATGLAPHQYVIHQRVERAKQLIRAGRLTLVQVAAEVGFTDQSGLTKHFKRVVGVTPKRFR